MAFTGARASSSTSSYSLPPQYYDVFLSFVDDDTYTNFTDHLYAALVRRRVNTFREQDNIERGGQIAPELLKTIEGSRISIVVFSRNYAASRFCLDELMKIMECKTAIQQIVLPVFYDIDPSDVRAQRGSFAEAFSEHEHRYKGNGMEGKVERWRAALTEAANLSGYDLQNMADGFVSTAIERIVQEILVNLNVEYLLVAKYPVGIESRVQRAIELLELRSSVDVRMVGIWGIGGIGKTTIAKAIYNQIHLQFEGSTFLANVREISNQPNGLVGLQEQLLSDILLKGKRKIRNVHQGVEVIKQKLHHRRVLVVLDDVDDLRQLDALAIGRYWFHPGSRIIITTRDESLLKLVEVDGVYMPKLLSPYESLQLFSGHAFKEDHPMEGYEELSWEVVGYAKGLPLAVEVLGSFLLGRTMHEWKSALENLKLIPHDAIQKKLKISFDSLSEEQKDLFLDIACFFVGMDQNYIIKILDRDDFFPETELEVLSRRCLVRIDGDRLMMHDLLRDMGMEIARREHPVEPGRCRRLSFHKDVLDVLTSYEGTEAVEGLVLNLPRSNDIQVASLAFAKMNRLRLLKLNYVHLSGSYEHLSKRLRWLYWFGFPLKSIPSNLFMENVVVIDMRYSSLEHVWKGRKILYKLKILNVSHSHHLIETPDLSGCPGLEMLLLNDCTRLAEVHHSIECLDELVILDLKNCKNLWKLPPGVWKMTSIQNISLYGCPKLLEQLSEFTGLPSRPWVSSFSFWAAPMRIRDFINPSQASIQGLISLRRLDLAYCNLSCVPPELGSLISLNWLNLEGNNFSILPASIIQLSRLSDLFLSQCTRLQSLPMLPLNLKMVDAKHCRLLERISIGSDFRKSPFLYFPYCDKLVANILACNFRKSHLQNQELSAVGGFSILFPGGEFPDYFQYESVGSVLSFVVPLLPDQKILGWTLCIVIAGCIDESIAETDIDIAYPLLYEVKNKTKGLKRYYGPTFHDRPLYDQDHMWLHYAPKHYLELQVEAGDEIEYSVSFTADTQILVKKCGVNMIYVDDEKQDQAMIQYASSSNRDVILDKDVSADQAVVENKIMVGGSESDDPLNDLHHLSSSVVSHLVQRRANRSY